MKRILAGAIAALLSVSVFATTFYPLQLMNPAGSTSGQFILSTGPTTPPAFTTVTLSGLGALAITNNLSDVASVSAARTNLGLGTAAVVNTGTSGTTIPLLSAANTWALAQTFTVRPTFNGATPWDGSNLASPATTTGNLSQFAATTSAQLAGVLSDETGTGVSVFGTSPTITTPNIVGITNASNAAAGSVGEVISSAVTSTSVPTTGVAQNLTSIPLTAGDWDVQGFVNFGAAGTTTTTQVLAGANTVSATLPASNHYSQFVGSFPTGANVPVPVPYTRVNVSSATTVYLVVEAVFGTSTMTAQGFISARRAH